MSLKAKGINSVSQILEDLKNGLTRTPKDKQYDAAKGSIMEKYNLNGTELKTLFSHAQLKGRKVKKEGVVLDIDDDVTPQQENVEMEQTAVEEVEAVEAETTGSDEEAVESETTSFTGF